MESFFSDGCSVDLEMRSMSKSMIETAIPEYKFSRGEKRSRRVMLERVAMLPNELQKKLRDGVASKVLSRNVVSEDQDLVMGDVDDEEIEEIEGAGMTVDEEPADGEDLFLKPQTQTIINQCIAEFIDATGNECVRQHVCFVCAREMWGKEVERCGVEDIPNKHCLSPNEFHPAHALTFGMLVERGVVDRERGRLMGDVCHECLRALSANKTPALSLANGMWIGDVPFQLSILSLPEKLLVAKYFPAAYIVKLSPKQKGASHWSSSGMNSGVRGNVATYRLNVEDIKDIVDSKIMPPPARILASVIGVVIVGPKNMPERTMLGYFRVRRDCVREALKWLSEHNPLYADSHISETRLAELPENDVPREIIESTRYSDDINNFERSKAGYVDEDDDMERTEDVNFCMAGVKPVRDDEDEDMDVDGRLEPEVVPLQSLGVVDVGGTDVAEHDALSSALVNVSKAEQQKSFAVKRGSDFVNEYARKDLEGERSDGGPDNPNHLLGAFPTLYCYGKGGIETSRPIDVSYGDHVRRDLQYWDRRFRKDLHYVFQVFGVLQKRQVCKSAGIQIGRKDFKKNEGVIQTLKPGDLAQAAEEESRRVPFSNPAVRHLRKYIRSTRAKVMGTDESRVSLRSKVWSLTAHIGPPSLWITINPSDTGDPIAQVLAGADIDLDKFVNERGPDATARSNTIAGDPFAAAKYFHFIIDCVLEILFGVKASRRGSHVVRKSGIFGEMAGYIGAVEAQARGTLHFHVIAWLKGSPTSSRMKELLQKEGFRKRVTDFIASNIRSDIGGGNGQQIKSMKKEKAVSYSRPVDPRGPNYMARAQQTEDTLARATQVHTCTVQACLKLVKNRLVCKRHAPFALSEDNWIAPDGSWGSKRRYGYINAWSPPIMQTVRCNQDIKLISNGTETKDVTWYFSGYVAKNQREICNSSALLAKRLAFHEKQERYSEDTKSRNKRLLQRCANTLSREQVFGAPEVISYLMNFGDRKLSHNFVTLYMSDIYSTLKKTYPSLCDGRHNSSSRGLGEDCHSPVLESCEDSAVPMMPSEDDEVLRLKVVDGQLQPISQLNDYANRGPSLDKLSLWEFFRDTYNGVKVKSVSKSLGKRSKTRCSVRSAFLNDTDMTTKCRVLRQAGHETIVDFIGPWIPRNDKPADYSLYCATMLTLLVPWRSIGAIHGKSLSLEAEFQDFLEKSTAQQRKFMQDVQYYYESSDRVRRRKEESVVEGSIATDWVTEESEDYDVFTEDIQELIVTEDDIEYAIGHPFAPEESAFAQVGINIAADVGIFPEGNVLLQPGIVRKGLSRIAGYEDIKKHQRWKALLDKVAEHDTDESLIDNSEDLMTYANVSGVADECEVSSQRMEEETDPDLQYLQELNTEQRMAHDIVLNHLDAELAGRNPPQLLMIVFGHGGTGKSTLLNAITTSFARRDSTHLFAKTAMSGVAASLIGGTTLHSWAGLPTRKQPTGQNWMDRSSRKIKDRRKKNMSTPSWHSVDEFGMLTKDSLCYLSQVAGLVRTGNGRTDSTIALGGLNEIFTGDFHQFPPVGQADVALYRRDCPRHASVIGENIYRQFDTVIELVEQNRIDDPRWAEILKNARTGSCTEDDISEIDRLVLTNEKCTVPDFSRSPWRDVRLVTPRNSMRVTWNALKLRDHCRRMGEILYVVDAEDLAGRERRILSQKERLTVAQMNVADTERLQNRVEIAIGMQAMVTQNIATDASLANGSRGIVLDIVLDAREESEALFIDDEGLVRLTFPPAMVLFQPFRKPNMDVLPGLLPSQVPIFPVDLSFCIGGKKGVKVTRRQLPLTQGYAFTDHKAQGQTLEFVLVDIGRLSRFAVNAFASYVALSRGRGRHRIRLLRDYDPKLFTTHPSVDLREEDRRLTALVEETKQKWLLGYYKYDD